MSAGRLRLLDVFPGIGGLSLAAQWAGIETVAFCEIDPWCQSVLRAPGNAIVPHMAYRIFRAIQEHARQHPRPHDRLEGGITR